MHRIAIVGCGGMARAHIGRFENQEDRAKVVATVDIDEEKAKGAAEHFEGAKPATDYRDIIDEIDAALLVLPHHLHHSIGMDFLQAGKHVLLEKPMALSEQECLDLIEAAEKQRRVLMIAYCQRFNPLVTRTKELIDAKTYGECFQVSIWTEQLTKYHPGHWALDAKTLGGGQFFSHGCHYVDLLLWILGRPVRGTHLGSKFCTPWMDKEGTSNACIEFENGALGYHFGTWGASASRLRYTLHAHCEEGMIEAALSQGKLIVHQKGEEETLMDSETGKNVAEEMGHFLDCIEAGQTPLTSGPESLQGLKVIWRLYEAEEQNVVADLRGCGLDEFEGTTGG